MKLNDTMVLNILSTLCPNWDTRGAEIYSLKEVLPELAVKSKAQSKPKKHNNYIEELLTKYGRNNNETTD